MPCLSFLCFVLRSEFFFFKQKTAYEMRISDWSSDVCSSDLPTGSRRCRPSVFRRSPSPAAPMSANRASLTRLQGGRRLPAYRTRPVGDRKSVVEGKRVSVLVDLGGRRIIKQNSPF